MKWSERRGKESKCSQWSNPESWAQYIYQYKIQYIIPNTFSNKESIAQEDSLHNQLKNFISYPLIVWGGGEGGGEGLLITTPHYDGITFDPVNKTSQDNKNHGCASHITFSTLFPTLKDHASALEQALRWMPLVLSIVHTQRQCEGDASIPTLGKGLKGHSWQALFKHAIVFELFSTGTKIRQKSHRRRLFFAEEIWLLWLALSREWWNEALHVYDVDYSLIP